MDSAHIAFKHYFLKLKKNAVRCDICFDTIESTSVHDMRWCRCEHVSVDGGFEYPKRSWNGDASWTDLSVYGPKSVQEIEDMMRRWRAEKRTNKIYSDGYYDSAIKAAKYHLKEFHGVESSAAGAANDLTF